MYNCPWLTRATLLKISGRLTTWTGWLTKAGLTWTPHPCSVLPYCLNSLIVPPESNTSVSYVCASESQPQDSENPSQDKCQGWKHETDVIIIFREIRNWPTNFPALSMTWYNNCVLFSLLFIFSCQEWQSYPIHIELSLGWDCPGHPFGEAAPSLLLVTSESMCRPGAFLLSVPQLWTSKGYSLFHFGIPFPSACSALQQKWWFETVVGLAKHSSTCLSSGQLGTP